MMHGQANINFYALFVQSMDYVQYYGNFRNSIVDSDSLGWTVRGSNPRGGGTIFSALVQTDAGAHRVTGSLSRG